MFAVRRIAVPLRRTHKGPVHTTRRAFNNRHHTGVISTPPTTPVGHITKVVHCGAMLFCWLAPIAYFLGMLDYYKGNKKPAQEEE